MAAVGCNSTESRDFMSRVSIWGIMDGMYSIKDGQVRFFIPLLLP